MFEINYEIEGTPRFEYHVIKEGHENKIEEIVIIRHIENNNVKINIIKEMEILKAASSQTYQTTS